MNVFIIILLLNIVNGYLISPKNKIQYFYGNYILRTTDDLSLKSKYTFLVLSENNKIKLKTINLKGIFSSKVSRSGTIVFAKNHKLFNPFLENDIDIQVKFNNINKYTFSILGIEFPEIKYKEISYVKQKNFRLKQKNYTLYIVDNDKKFYYLFDINTNLNRLPYVETQVFTLLATQIISFIINLCLFKLLEIHF